MYLWKITDRDGKTHNDMHWEPGVAYRESGSDEEDGAGWLHAFTDFWRAALAAARCAATA